MSPWFTTPKQNKDIQKTGLRFCSWMFRPENEHCKSAQTLNLEKMKNMSAANSDSTAETLYTSARCLVSTYRIPWPLKKKGQLQSSGL